MWIIPRNHSLSSRFARDMVGSSEDLSSLASDIESSLMWRSKPSPWRTWLQRWKRVSWMQPLCTRILKPCQWAAFETELTSSLAAIHASHFQPPGKEPGQTTPDTSGRTSTTSSKQLDLFAVSLKTSKDTSALDSERSLKTWKDLITRRRLEYSARLKSERPTSGSGSTSWRPPTASDWKNMDTANQTMLANQVNWPTPRASEYKDCGPVGSKSHTHMDKRSYLCAMAKDPDQPRGLLNPTWVEWLMGVPTEWTGLGSWGME